MVLMGIMVLWEDNMENGRIHNQKCELCKRAVADKTNSHIVPSFIICRTASSDGSGKRNHELVYSIGKTIQVYAGNEVPMEVLNMNFDDLSDERVDEELKKNTLSKDYVFCSSCEKALGDFLESPYAAKKSINAQTAYYFWLSILWRVNHFGTLSSKMPKFILTELRKNLDLYLQAKREHIKTVTIQQKYPFRYRILTCTDYSINGAGCIYAEFDKSNRIFTITLGDSIVCYNFEGDILPGNYSFLGIEEDLKQAISNDGVKTEEERFVTKDIFAKAYSNLMGKSSILYLNNEVTMIYRLWNELIKRHYEMPSIIPSESFIHRCLEIIHNDKKKVGERYTKQNFAISFCSTLTEIYGITVSNE